MPLPMPFSSFLTHIVLCVCYFALFKTPDAVHPKEAPPSSTASSIRPARVVSSTSEEEEAFTEKFLKINCKYITNGKVMNNIFVFTKL